MKQVALLFFLVYGILALIIIWGWVHFAESNDGEIGATLFMMCWFLASLLIAGMLFWTYRLFKMDKLSTSVKLQYLVIGVVAGFCIYSIIRFAT